METQMTGPTDYLLVHEVAQLERVAARTVVHWIRNGKLKAVRNPGSRKWLIPVWAYWEYKHAA